MCDKCVAAVKLYFPRVRRKDYKALLMGATCFPFGTPEIVSSQLREMRDLGITSVDAACAYASEEMDRDMRHCNWMEEAGYLAVVKGVDREQVGRWLGARGFVADGPTWNRPGVFVYPYGVEMLVSGDAGRWEGPLPADEATLDRILAAVSADDRVIHVSGITVRDAREAAREALAAAQPEPALSGEIQYCPACGHGALSGYSTDTQSAPESPWWVPVTERVPEHDHGPKLVTLVANGFFWTLEEPAYFNFIGRWVWWSDRTPVKPIVAAWRDYPEPYRPPEDKP